MNDSPIAANDTYEVVANAATGVDVSNGVLANDSDPEQDPLQATLVADVAHGTLTLSADGSFTYKPNPAYSGEDSFTYVAGDGTLSSPPATALITVLPPVIIPDNQAPRIVTGVIAFKKQTVGVDVRQTHAVLAQDFDGDADIDIVATDYIHDDVLWYEQVDGGDFVEHTVDDDLDGAYPAHLGDVDLDGDVDILAGGYLANTFAWYENDGSAGFTRHDIDTAAAGAHSIMTYDIDKDGDIDLITSNQDGGTIDWYENNGANQFTRHLIDDTAVKAKRADVVDIDDDGDLDVISAAFENGEIAWHENDGNMGFSKHLIDTKARGAYYVSSADVDGDGDVDVLSANRRTSTVAWYENDGNADFTLQAIDTDVGGVRSLFPIDINQDGHIDVLSAGVDIDAVIWYQNDGEGTFTEHPIDLDSDGAYGVFAVDIDRDGDIDALSANRDSHTVELFRHIRSHSITAARGADFVIDGTRLKTIDSDDGPIDLIYSLAAIPTSGTLLLSGEALAVSDTFTQDDVDNNPVNTTAMGSTVGRQRGACGAGAALVAGDRRDARATLRRTRGRSFRPSPGAKPVIPSDHRSANFL